jgi:lysophospholipase L1-like esterase
MGDSITDNLHNPRMGGFFPGKPYLNRGISGQTTSQMLLRFYPDVIALQPQAVVIFAGTNDIGGNLGPVSIESIEDNLAAMSDIARAHNIKVIMASVTPVCDIPGRNPMTVGRPPESILTLNRWIKDLTAKQGTSSSITSPLPSTTKGSSARSSRKMGCTPPPKATRS